MSNVTAGIEAAALLSGKLSDEQINALGQLRLRDLTNHQIDDVMRRAALQEIARWIRVSVLVDYEVSYESDDGGGFFRVYTVALRLTENGAARVRLDHDLDYALDCCDDPCDAAAMVAVLGTDRSTATFDDDGGVLDIALTSEGEEAMHDLYEAAVVLARQSVDTSVPISPAAASP